MDIDGVIGAGRWDDAHLITFRADLRWRARREQIMAFRPDRRRPAAERSDG